MKTSENNIPNIYDDSATSFVRLLNMVERESWGSPGRTDTWWIILISLKLKKEGWYPNVRIDVRYFIE